MKRFILSVLMCTLVFGCSSSDNENADSTRADSTAEPQPVPESVVPEPPPPVAAVEEGEARLERVGALSLEEAFEAVARDIQYAPYPGVLREPQGTARAGSGNALDQALLLAEIVGEQVATYRFARGRLDDEPLETLLASVHRPDAPWPAFSADTYDLYDPTQDTTLADIARDHVSLEIKQADSLGWLPLAPLDPDKVAGISAGTNAMNLAKTPIAQSLELVTQDLEGVEGRTLILLITDGEETCDGDPAAAVQMLKDAGFDIRLNIIGFAIDDAALKSDFETWADLGDGRYFDAQGADELSGAVREALRPKFQVLDATGSVVAEGTVNSEAMEVPAGRYTVKVLTSPPQTFEAVEIRPEETLELEAAPTPREP